jgi:hypothetical protein
VLLPTQAQSNNPNLERELQLEKEYNPSVREADKINQLPEIREPEAPKTQVQFSDYTLNYSLSPYISNLQAQNYLSNFATSEKRGYLNVGVSSLIDINGDVGYQILHSERDFLSIFASHRSSNSDVKFLQNDEKQKMKINDNLGGLNYIHRFDKAKFFADAQYTYSGFNNYSFNNVLPDLINNLFKTQLAVASVNNEDINYKVSLGYSLFDQKNDSTVIWTNWEGRTENRILADFDLHAHFSATGGVGLAGSMKNYSYSKNPSLDLDNDYTTLAFNPYFTFDGGDWDVRLGVSANMQVGDLEEFFIAPDIQFNWRPTDQFLLYVLAEGGIKDNSSYNMFYENRYVNPSIRVLDSKTPINGTFGLNFLLLPNLEMGVFTGYKLTEDEHFFKNQGILSTTYRYTSFSIMSAGMVPLYDKAETFKFGGLLKYAYQDIFHIGLNLSYYNWQVRELAHAWHKPNFVGDVNMGFKIPDLPLRMDLVYRLEAGRKANEENNMKNINDLSLKASYDINNSFTVFAQANNLLFQRYDLWWGYPAQDFNIMGGISVKF